MISRLQQHEVHNYREQRYFSAHERVPDLAQPDIEIVPLPPLMSTSMVLGSSEEEFRGILLGRENSIRTSFEFHEHLSLDCSIIS